MNKRKTKKAMRKTINLLPENRSVKDFVFLVADDMDYGANTYKGVKVYSFKLINKGHIYLIPKTCMDDVFYKGEMC